MHYIKFRRIARVLYFSSVVLFLAFLAALTTIGLGIALQVTDQSDLLVPFGISAGVFLMVALFQLILTSQCRCQLCRSLILRPLKCSRIPTAKPILGSYRLKVATTIILLRRFRCPYCGELFSLGSRPEQAGSSPQTTGHTRRVGSNLPSRRP